MFKDQTHELRQLLSRGRFFVTVQVVALSAILALCALHLYDEVVLIVADRHGWERIEGTVVKRLESSRVGRSPSLLVEYKVANDISRSKWFRASDFALTYFEQESFRKLVVGSTVPVLVSISMPWRAMLRDKTMPIYREPTVLRWLSFLLCIAVLTLGGFLLRTVSRAYKTMRA